MPRRKAAPKDLTRDGLELAIAHLQRRLEEFDRLEDARDPVLREMLTAAWTTRGTREKLRKVVLAIVADRHQQRTDRIVAWLAATTEQRADSLKRMGRIRVTPSVFDRVGRLMAYEKGLTSLRERWIKAQPAEFDVLAVQYELAVQLQVTPDQKGRQAFVQAMRPGPSRTRGASRLPSIPQALAGFAGVSHDAVEQAKTGRKRKRAGALRSLERLEGAVTLSWLPGNRVSDLARKLPLAGAAPWPQFLQALEALVDRMEWDAAEETNIAEYTIADMWKDLTASISPELQAVWLAALPGGMAPHVRAMAEQIAGRSIMELLSPDLARLEFEIARVLGLDRPVPRGEGPLAMELLSDVPSRERAEAWMDSLLLRVDMRL